MNIAKVAAAHGGSVTWTFSQSALSTWINYRTYAWKGICAALSTHWIKHHANEGSLANVLGGGNVGGLNIPKLREIGAQHEHATGTNTQEDMLLLWLKMNEIIPVGVSYAYPTRTVGSRMPSLPRSEGRSFVANTRSARDEHISAKGTPSVDVADGIVTALRRLRGKPFYAYITFGGTCFGANAGHVVAAYIGQPSYSGEGDALFFDPNYGEVWFDRKTNFFEFFPDFYRRAYLSGTMNFNRRWSMQPLGKAMAFAR